jgi:hypothetical protein
MVEIDRKLRFAFGETAIAIDKSTGKYFLNTEAIERNIKATSDETKTDGCFNTGEGKGD